MIEVPQNDTEQWLVSTISRQAEKVSIDMPEVAIFQSSAPNAFATGANKNTAIYKPQVDI